MARTVSGEIQLGVLELNWTDLQTCLVCFALFPLQILNQWDKENLHFCPLGVSLGLSSGEGLDGRCSESNRGVKNNQLPFVLCELERRKVKQTLWGCFILLLLKLWRKTQLSLSLSGLADRSSVIESLETKSDALIPWWGPWRERKPLEGSREKHSEVVTGWKSPQPLREVSNKCLKMDF